MKAGRRLGPFVLESPIAAGGMGQVWAARHVAGLPVAIKVLAGPISAQGKAALWAEARAVARIDHPGVVRLLDVGEVEAREGEAPCDAADTTETLEATAWARTAYAAAVDTTADGSPFLVMERADGTLADRLPLPPTDALAALRAVLDALAAAHARGIVHRDVKPANVLRIGGRWVLADFGVAAAVDGVVGARSGTPRYMAPEQVVGDGPAQGPWTDLYAVGCLAHALLTGRPPFDGADRQALTDAHRFGRPPPLPALPGLPPHMSGWVDRLLAKDPGRRFRCAADALAALDGAPTPVGFSGEWRDPPREPPFHLVGAGLGLYGHRSVPLVGREEERAALWSTLGAVHASGDLRLALIVGEPGVGKSRLVRWLVERAAERGLARVVYSQGDAPLGQGLRRAMNLDDVPAGDVAPLVARALADAEPTPAEVQAVAGLLTGRLAGDRRARAAVMAQWLGLWALERPVIWWIDDAHRASEALDAVAQCLRVDDGAGLPLLVVLSAREGEAVEGPAPTTVAATAAELGPTRDRMFDLMRRPQTLALALDPLPALDARRLVRSLLHLDGAVADALERRAAGHPGFAVRWVADRIEQGQLVPGRDGFRPAAGATLDLPSDLVAVWRARAAALARRPEEQRLLELATALGPRVCDRVWRRAAGGLAPHAVALLSRLMRQGSAVADGPGHWRLALGPLVEAIAAESARRGRWAAVNRAAASALSQEDAPDPALLARLYRQGEQPAAAIAPLLAAAEQALDRGAYAAALAWLDDRRGLLTGPDPADALADHLRIRALRKLQRPAEALIIAEALWAMPPVDQRLWTLIQIESAALLRQRGRLDDGLAMTRRALETARATGDPGLVCTAATTLARQLAIAGHYAEAEPVAAESLARAVDLHSRGSALYGMGLLFCRLQQWDRARTVLEDCRETWRTAGHLHGVSDAENQLADVARGMGDLDVAAAHYQQSIAYARLAGISVAVPLLNQGMLTLELEAWEEARRLLRQAAAALLQEGNALAAAFAKVGRLQAAAALGDAAEWADALAMPRQPAATGWGEMVVMLDEAIALGQAAGFDTAPVEAMKARWQAV